MARLAPLEAFVQWAYRVWVIHGSRTCKGALPANRGASAAAPPAVSAAALPPASPVGPPVRGAVVPWPTVGAPSPAAVSPFHVRAAEVVSANGENLASEIDAGVECVWGAGWP